jgi:hypothetical protein
MTDKLVFRSQPNAALSQTLHPRRSRLTSVSFDFHATQGGLDLRRVPRPSSAALSSLNPRLSLGFELLLRTEQWVGWSCGACGATFGGLLGIDGAGASGQSEEREQRWAIHENENVSVDFCFDPRMTKGTGDHELRVERRAFGR